MKTAWINTNRTRFAVLLLLFGLAQAACAAMTIEVFGGAASRIPVSIVPFAGAPAQAQIISDVVGGDLERSGQFKLVDARSVLPPPTDAGDVQFPAFRALGSDAAVIGRIVPLPDGRLEVRFRLMDVVKQTQVAALNYTITPAQLRATGHKIADVVYEKLTGIPGSFSTHIAYIIKHGKHYQLLVADSDGQDPQVVVNSAQPIDFAGLVARRHAHRLCLVREQKTGGLRTVAGQRYTPRAGQFQGQQQRARLVAGWHAAGSGAVARQRFANLHHQGRWQRCEPSYPWRQYRYRTGVESRWQIAAIYLRPRRQPADLPHVCQRRRYQAHHL